MDKARSETYELGANVLPGGELSFLLWAPFHKKISLKLVGHKPKTVSMEPLEGGYFLARVPDPGGNVRYFYLLENGLERPDPASRSQPEGVHGPSSLVRFDEVPSGADAGLPRLKDYITYELHVGTFSPEGTFDGVINQIPYLKELGINAVELMPVAQFPGGRNWGYDGVHPYAPQNTYGGPEGFMRLVEQCHSAGLAVVLDVVYNHLGPEGNYLGEFGPYFTDRYHGQWGDAVNFDGSGSHGVRRFIVENALFWFRHYEIDALRIDAVHGIFDSSPCHIMKELHDTVNEQIKDRNAFLIGETDWNDAKLIDSDERGGYCIDAQWNDDFHHSLRTLLTGDKSGYYEDFGSLTQLAKAIREGFVYTGEYSRFRGEKRGTSSVHLEPHKFVVFSQNHDQIGNQLMGERLSTSVSKEKLKLAASLVLLSANLPLLFMGEEYAEQAPFQYFISHSDPGLIEAVRRGRKEEFAGFHLGGQAPDPQAEDTFFKCKISPEARLSGVHKEMFALYRRLIEMRKTHLALRAPSRERMRVDEDIEQRVITIMRWHGDSHALMLASFGDSASKVKLPEGNWKLVLDTAPDVESGPNTDGSVIIDRPVHLAPYGFKFYEKVT